MRREKQDAYHSHRESNKFQENVYVVCIDVPDVFFHTSEFS